MTSMKALEEAVKTVNFDKNQAIIINDKNYKGYREVEEKLEEAIAIMKKYNLI